MPRRTGGARALIRRHTAETLQRARASQGKGQVQVGQALSGLHTRFVVVLAQIGKSAIRCFGYLQVYDWAWLWRQGRSQYFPWSC